MSCPLLEYVFANGQEISSLQVTLAIKQGGIFIDPPATLSGSGELVYTPFHRVGFENSPFFFFAPPLFSGVIGCNVVWQYPDGSQTVAQENITVQIASPWLVSSSYQVSLSTAAGSPVHINGSFAPECSLFIWGENHGTLTGLAAECPVSLLLEFPRPPL